MTSQEFCYWLQGYFELSTSPAITPEQAKVIKEHLQLVFNKVTVSVVVPNDEKPNKNGDIVDKDVMKRAIADWIERQRQPEKMIMTCTQDHNFDLNTPIC